MSLLIRSASFTKFSEVARGIGIDPERAVRHVGLDLSCLHQPDLRVPETSLAELLEVSARSAPNASLGLLMGESWRIADFGVVSLLLQHQSTLGDALAQLQNYRHLISDSVVLDVSEQGDTAIIEVKLVTVRTDHGRHPMELTLAATLSLCRHVLGPRWTPRSVHFSHAAPPTLRAHQALFGSQLVFGAGMDAIVLNRGDLHRPHAGSDAALGRYAQAILDQMPRPGERAVAHEVRRALHLLLPRGHQGVEQVSRHLGLSARTLQRRLEQAGLSFQQVLNETRKESAQRYLEGGTYSVSEIAGLLGFGEVSAFSRWFAQQFGQPPSRWQRG